MGRYADRDFLGGDLRAIGVGFSGEMKGPMGHKWQADWDNDFQVWVVLVRHRESFKFTTASGEQLQETVVRACNQAFANEGGGEQ